MGGSPLEDGTTHPRITAKAQHCEAIPSQVVDTALSGAGGPNFWAPAPCFPNDFLPLAAASLHALCRL